MARTGLTFSHERDAMRRVNTRGNTRQQNLDSRVSNKSFEQKWRHQPKWLVVPRDPLLHNLTACEPERGFQFDHERFLENLRAAGGPSGMTAEHLRVDNDRGRRLLVWFGGAVRTGSDSRMVR